MLIYFYLVYMHNFQNFWQLITILELEQQSIHNKNNATNMLNCHECIVPSHCRLLKIAYFIYHNLIMIWALYMYM